MHRMLNSAMLRNIPQIEKYFLCQNVSRYSSLIDDGAQAWRTTVLLGRPSSCYQIDLVCSRSRHIPVLLHNYGPVLRMNPVKEEFSPRRVVIGLDAAYSKYLR